MKENITILDATLRDGGLVNKHCFSIDFVKKLYNMNILSGTDYMEFGYRADKKIFSPDEYGIWKFSSDDDIRKVVGDNKTNLKISIMIDVGRCNYMNDIHNKSDSPVDLIRIATYIYQIDDAIHMIEYVAKKGYAVTCNIMATSECSERQLWDAAKRLRELPLQAVYIVDSYGAMYPKDIRKMTQLYKDVLSSQGIAVGIHAHNNQQCAFANTIEGLDAGASWLDATVFGMGRGAGNCYLEALMGYLHKDKYKIEPILRVIQDEMIRMKFDENTWGYNTYYLLTGIANKHPRTAIFASKQNNIDLIEFMKNEMLTDTNGK